MQKKGVEMAGKKKVAPTAVKIDGGLDIQGIMGRLDKIVQRGRLVCADGFSVSAQANEFSHCSPRENEGPYDSVELGYPSREVPSWLGWAEDPGALTQTIYSRIPVGAVAYVVAESGGRQQGADWSMSGLDGHSLAAADKALSIAGPTRIDADAGLRAWGSACARWVQEAVLGSPAAEGAARFEVWRGDEMLLDWNRCLGCFLAAGFDDAANNDTRGWVSGMREIAHLEVASKAGQKAPRRRFL